MDWSASPALTIIADHAAAAEEAAGLAGLPAARTIAWADLGDAPRFAGPILAEAEGVDEAVLTTALPRLAAAARDGGAALVVAIGLAQLDLAHAALGPGAVLLCDAGPAERVAALVLARAAPGAVRETDSATRLAALAEEIARLAAALAALPPERAGGQALADRTPSYAPPPDEEPSVNPAELRAALRARRLRDGLLGPGWFADPVWDMLLDLFAAELEGRDVSISSLCIAAAVAPTTALRQAGRMEAAGLIGRRPDPADRRRVFLRLAPETRARLARHLAELRRLGLPIA
jgi:hypothetical protein